MVRSGHSLSPRAAWMLFAGFAAVSLTIGTGFLLMGAWLVLPFSGLEVAGVGLAGWWLGRRRQDHERLQVRGDRLRVERHHRGRREVVEFQCQWARIELRPGGPRWYPARLWVGSHGRWVEIARGADEKTRRGIAERLKRFLGAGYR